MGESCPLCQQLNGEPFYKDAKRAYLQCSNCHLVYVPQIFHISLEQEKAEYDLHQNSADDLGYRKFLGRIFNPLIERLPPQSCGLDFGSGPGPTLSVMFEEQGHQVALFDKFYAPDQSVFNQTYDFVTATEVVEHLKHPTEELTRLWGCLRPGGWLGIMTKRVIDLQAFSHWHYKNDLTHISFFSEHTFRWWAKHNQTQPEFIGKDVVLFQKGS
ncbi:MAG: class I SAM-dependent methyltransferase [Chloroflexota bacterium]